MHVARNMNSGRQRGEFSDKNIVPDGAVEVYMNMLLDLDVYRENTAATHYRTDTKLHKL